MFGTLKAKIVLGVVIALFTFGVVHIVKLRSEYNDLLKWQSAVLQATKQATQNQKLGAKDVATQIEALGQSLLNFKNQIVVQNKAVADLTVKRDEALAARDREAALRKEVIGKSQSLAQELRNAALSPVERDKLEAELRRVQDMAWEAGL